MGFASEGDKKRGPQPSLGSLEAATLGVHAEPIGDFLDRVEVSSTAGLSEAAAAERLAQHGPNRLPEAKKKSDVLRILEQFVNPLVLTLLAAAAIAVVVGVSAGGEHGFLGRFGDAIAIMLIVVLNAF